MLIRINNSSQHFMLNCLLNIINNFYLKKIIKVQPIIKNFQSYTFTQLEQWTIKEKRKLFIL